MDNQIIIDKTKEYIKDRLEGEGTGHDWWHIERVYKIAQYIGEKENADLYVIRLAALLHDIADWKFNKDNINIGSRLAQEWLKQLEVEEFIVKKVVKIIETMSFKGGTTDSKQDSIEGMIVQDADRLDALGAIGIARTFAYGGYKGNEIYNPNIEPQIYESFDQYKNSASTTINHFYEKLLLLKDLMNTNTAKEMAQERHEYMENYLKQFFREWG